MLLLLRKEKNELETITGGSSSDNEVLYYKFVDNDKMQDLFGASYGQIASTYMASVAYYLNIISIKYNSEDSPIIIGRNLRVSGSSQISDTDATMFNFQNLLEDRTILGFALYKGENINYNSKYNEYYYSPEGNLLDKWISVFGIKIEELPEGEEKEIITILVETINTCFISISKEEYYKL